MTLQAGAGTAPAEARGEREVRDEFEGAGGLARGTQENYRGWIVRFTSWCEANGLAAFPAEDETAQLFLHAHHPRWRYSYAKAFPAALRAEHRLRQLPVPELDGLGEYLRRLSGDEATSLEQEKVAALRVQEADTIRAALSDTLRTDPPVARVRAVLVVTALVDLPLLDVPARSLGRPDLLWSERLPASALVSTDAEVRLKPPGGVEIIVVAQRNPRHRRRRRPG